MCVCTYTLHIGYSLLALPDCYTFSYVAILAIFEVAIIDDDNVDNGVQGELAEKLKTHKCCSITVVIPCYMPNEQEINSKGNIPM